MCLYISIEKVRIEKMPKEELGIITAEVPDERGVCTNSMQYMHLLTLEYANVVIFFTFSY